jgi:cell wall-associated NlpC family hydrolase
VPTIRLAADRALTDVAAAATTAAPGATARAVRRPARRPARHATRASRSQARHHVHPRPPRRPLRVGSHGPRVRWLQARLGVRRTGLFAGHTRSAVRRFQRRHHVRADGVVGRRTWTLLARSASRHRGHHRPHAAHRHGAHRHGAHRHGAHRHAAHRHGALKHSGRGHAAFRHSTRGHAAHRRGHVLRAGHHARRLSVRQRANIVIRLARAQRGKPYVWGAAGPHAFDCSGYVQWVFRHALGVRLPKYTDTQYGALAHIRASHLRRGDLVFIREGRHESHVGIYAGYHRWWVAPHTGSHVKLQRIWPAHHVYARVIR